MIYLVGGAPRAGKSVLGQRVAARLNIGWAATDALRSVLKEEGASDWDASPRAIAATAEWFFPHLSRFVGGMSSLAEHYLIEGVHFLPKQVAELSRQFDVRSVFVGCSALTLEQFDSFPGRSPGYAGLPLAMKQRIVGDLPGWSEFVAREAASFGYAYVDTSGDFATRLAEAERSLMQGSGSGHSAPA
ncbi:MAG TPA: hypothetical protein VMG12_42300 [Polyangiaceae bacterium]|nr:hypothetical protein [Polyangiaceae bacterium]